MTGRMFHKCAGFISCVCLVKSPPKPLQIFQSNQIFLLPIKPVGNPLRLPIGGGQT